MTKIRIDGPFITFYSAKEAHRSAQALMNRIRFMLADRGYYFLSKGAGPMHDFAHMKYMKEKEREARLEFGIFAKTNHWHIACPGIAGLNDLERIFHCVGEGELTKDLRKQILDQYSLYLSQPNIERCITTLKSYLYLQTAIKNRDKHLQVRMPILFSILKEITNHPNEQQIKTEYCLIDAVKWSKGLALWKTQLYLLDDLVTLLTSYKNSTLSSEDLIKCLQEKFLECQEKMILNLNDVLPEIKSELIQNLPYIDLSELYTNMASDLSQLLNFQFRFESQNQPNHLYLATEKISSFCLVM